MKKILFLLLAATFCLSYENNAIANDSTNANTTTITATQAEFIESVEAQDANGYKTKYLKIYGRRLANGKYHYFAKVKSGTREFNIHYANNNRYKPFYVTINGERWYFNSTNLDFYSGKTDQW